MKKIVVVFSLCLSLTISANSTNNQHTYTPLNIKFKPSIGENNPKEAEVPNLFNDEFYDFIESGAFEYSCGYEGSKLSNMMANQLPQKSGVGNHYFFFSLSAHYSDDQKKSEFRFFKGDNTKGNPKYVLNSEGLKEDGKVICKWNEPYSESFLFGNYLPDCLENKHNFLGFISTSHAQDAIRLCSVINVEDYKVHSDGTFAYYIKIGDEKYLLDVSSMPGLKDGTNFYSKEKRGKIISERESEKRYQIAKKFMEIKSSDSFQRLYNCFDKKDKACVNSFLSKSFLESMASAGYDPICRAGHYSTNDKVLACDESHKVQIYDAAYAYVLDFLNSINNLNVKNIEVLEQKNKMYFRFTPEKYHTDMGQGIYEIELHEGNLIFLMFDDGLTC